MRFKASIITLKTTRNYRNELLQIAKYKKKDKEESNSEELVATLNLSIASSVGSNLASVNIL